MARKRKEYKTAKRALRLALAEGRVILARRTKEAKRWREYCRKTGLAPATKWVPLHGHGTIYRIKGTVSGGLPTLGKRR